MLTPATPRPVPRGASPSGSRWGRPSRASPSPIKTSTGHTHTHTTAEHTRAEQTTHTNTERTTAQRRLIVEVVVAAFKIVVVETMVYSHQHSYLPHPVFLTQGGKPIGLKVGASIKGLTLSYEVILPDDPRAFIVPPPAPPHAPPAGAGGPPPEIDFGVAVPIFDATTRMLLVTNHSAVPTSFRAQVCIYRHILIYM